jgi:hypothetical protein
MKIVKGHSKGGEFTPEGMSAIKWENRKKKLGKFIQGLKDAPRKSLKSAVYMLYGGPFWDQLTDGEGFGTDTYFKDAFKKDESVIKTEKQLREVIRKTMHKLISEDKKYKAKKKDGKVVYFTNKDNWKNALKSGDYEKVDSKKVKDKPKSKPKFSGDPFGDDEFDVGGPSYPNVPKGAKSSEDVKRMKKNKEVEEFIKYHGLEGMGEPFWSVEIKGRKEPYQVRAKSEKDAKSQTHAAAYPTKIKTGKVGVDDDRWEKANNFALSDDPTKPDPSTDPDYRGEWDDIEKTAMGAADAANKKMDKAELDNAYRRAKELKKELRALVDKGDIETAKKKQAEIYKFWDEVVYPLEKKVKPEASKKWSDMLGQESVREAAGAVARGAARTAGKAAYKGAAMAGVAAKKAAKKMKDKKKEREDESLDKRVTVKEVRTWMKTLEENRYKKIYNSDARRVSWMVNNMGENVENMPVSMRKKWTKAQYGRERYLAKEFIKSKKRQMTENKIRKAIRIILEGKIVRYEIPMKDKKKVQALVKKLRFKDGKDYAIYGSGRTFEMELDAKHADKVLELLMKMNIKVRG